MWLSVSAVKMAIGRREKNKKKRGQGAGGYCRVREKKAKLFRVFFFFVLPPFNCKIAPPLCVLKAVIYRQNNVWASKLVPQLSLFCKF